MSNEFEYGKEIWKTDQNACYQEACRRVEQCLRNDEINWLFLSDLPLLPKLPSQIGRCKSVKRISIGSGKGPDGLYHPRTNYRALTSIDEIITLGQLEQVELRSTILTDITAVSHLPKLKRLDISSSTRIRDISAISQLKELEVFKCSMTLVTDISPLSNLEKLKTLNIGHTYVSDLRPLSTLSSLIELHADNSQISNLSPLSALAKLETLILSGTKIKDITALRNLKNLRKLIVSSNDLSDISSIEGLTKLEELNVNSCGLKSLEAIDSLINLRVLRASHNKITSVSHLSKMTELQELDISTNRIAEINSIDGMTTLEALKCDHNPIEVIPSFKKLNNLRTADFSDLEIENIQGLSKLTSLESLTLRSNNISDASPIGALVNLKHLDLMHTQIEDISEIKNLTQIEKLSLELTQTRNVDALADMTLLQNLDCADTPLENIEGIRTLSNIEHLRLTNTQISNIEPISTLGNLRHLDISNTDIADISSLSKLQKLETLGASNAKIVSIEELANLAHLKRLDLSENRISNALALKYLVGLESLSISHNDLESLRFAEELSSLSHLDISGTKVDSLEPLRACSNLRSLHISNTGIDDLNILRFLTKIEKLDCINTRITTVSPLRNGLSLKRLDISGCVLNEPPDLVGGFSRLEALHARNAKISGIPDEVISNNYGAGCVDQLKAHLIDLRENPTPLRDIKLMVLGNGLIGKTQICNRLRGLDFEDEADSTHGITLETTPIPGLVEGEEALLNIWDFGGQDIYHGTHALFLKSRAIFLLVWTPESENSETHQDANGMVFRNQPMGWWLDYVRRFGSQHSPLIVVQNQIDRFSRIGEHDAVTAFKADNPVGEIWSIAYSAKTRKGHGTLMDTLSQACDEFNPPLIGAGRRQMIETLRAMRADDADRDAKDRKYRTLPLYKFESLCRETGNISDPRLFLEFLHNAGEVFWREGHFSDQVIIDQEWVLEAIYAVFNRDSCVNTLTAQGGRFHASLLGALVWDAKGYDAEDQRLFIEFMKTSGMCFSLGYGRSETLIAPDYLPEAPPRKDITAFKPDSGTALDYDSLPPILMRNLIARIGQQAGANAEYWRHGVLFYDTGTRSKVRIEQTLTSDWAGTIRVDCAGGDHTAALDAVLIALSEECQRLSVSPTGQTETKESRASREDADTDGQPSTLSPGAELNREPEYYISYAWDTKGSTPPDKLTGIVDDLCEKGRERGIFVRRDKDHIKLGNRISEFMARLIKGDRIIIILSDKYLESPACMKELYGIWKHAGGEDEAFLEKVRVFTHDGTNIHNAIGRAQVARKWLERYTEGLDYLEDMAEQDKAAHHAMKAYYAHVADILYLFGDTLQPRTLDELAGYAFDD